MQIHNKQIYNKQERYSNMKYIIVRMALHKSIAYICFIYTALIYVLFMTSLSVAAANNTGIVNTRHLKYTYSEMENDIYALRNKYQEYVHVNILGTTVDDRNIYEVVLGNPDTAKCVMFQATVHAREYMCSQLVMKQIEYCLDNYEKKYNGESIHDILDKVCIHIVPMANPDGVTLAQKGIKGIRNKKLRKKLKKMPGISNPSNWKANARGVDINRQFDYKFEKNRSLKRYACYAGYGGSSPASERESKALLYVVDTYKPKAVVNYHAMGNVIFHNYKADKATAKKTKRLTAKIKKLTGYSYIGTSPGPGFANYLNRKRGIPSTTVEIGMYTTPVPISQFKAVWKQNKNVMIAVAQMYE